MQTFNNADAGAIVLSMAERIVENRAYLSEIDGKIGSNTRKQIGLYQKAARIKIDCWPSDSVLASANAQANR